MLSWGVIGAGNIAVVFCNAMRFSRTGRVVAVASRGGDNARELASRFSIDRHYTGYQALLADDAIDAVYVSTIHPAHRAVVLAAAAAGKHVLVEKPIGMTAADAEAMVAAAREHDVFLMEAFMYRCHPQTQRLAALVSEGAVGETLMISSSFGYNASYDPSSRAYALELGGGGILDVGCYPASMVRLLAGAAAGRPFLDPVEVKASGTLAPTGVDRFTAATCRFANDVVAQIACAVGCRLDNITTVYGSEGTITVANPWLPCSPCRAAKEPLPLDTSFPAATFQISHATGGEQEVTVELDRDLFTYEADTVAEHIATRQAPAMSWDDTLGNMRLLDDWRQEIGVASPADHR